MSSFTMNTTQGTMQPEVEKLRYGIDLKCLEETNENGTRKWLLSHVNGKWDLDDPNSVAKCWICRVNNSSANDPDGQDPPDLPINSLGYFMTVPTCRSDYLTPASIETLSTELKDMASEVYSAIERVGTEQLPIRSSMRMLEIDTVRNGSITIDVQASVETEGKPDRFGTWYNVLLRNKVLTDTDTDPAEVDDGTGEEMETGVSGEKSEVAGAERRDYQLRSRRTNTA
ncbi:hypothetical protein BD324DRAFT_681400 [Kockovaella imperatae]|uniref:Uncharacterized protein n=1 Tax=Kockovaella imperatae TaxID=4999 RepID=A0A1Y1UHR0_9TREE|nr:hypothetical protein BD324DRAFT_681400 [Kockovaella imperatae]ORX36625.1 hypothetical protein BD324DRAFT_681400 [Kockovaella imperatae]